MRTFRSFFIAALLLLPVFSAAQARRDSVRVYFQQGKDAFDPLYKDNIRRLTDFTNKVKMLQRDSLAKIDRVVVVGSASPEGSPEVNLRLTNGRAQGIASWLHEHMVFDQGAFEVYLNDLDWDAFEALVEADDRVPARDEILTLIRRHNLAALQVPARRRSWSYMLENLFPQMRSTAVIFEYETVEQETEPVLVLKEVPKPQQEEQVIQRPVVNTPPPMPDDDDFSLDLSEEERGWGWYLKTNIPAWVLLDANLAVEFEIGKHFSFSLPFYYSALDWFDVHDKFRVLGTQPELRVWLWEDFRGPFLAAHGTLGYYNIATRSMTYRIQDREGRHPAYGGGLNVGWKFHLDRNRADRWGLELSVGYGYLHLDYDRFLNEENGRLVNSVVEDYLGPDHAAVSLTYRFGK